MRKISFLLVLAFASMVGVAQTESGYKLGKGDVTTELQLSLLGTKASWYYDNNTDEEGYIFSGPISMNGLSLRFALSDKWAFRTSIGLDFGHKYNKVDIDDSVIYYSTREFTKGKSTNKSNYTQFMIAPGLEYHFGNWERMSVYMGGEVFFGMRLTQSDYSVKSTTEVIERDWSGEWVFKQKEEYESSFKTKNCAKWGGDWNPRYEQNGAMFFGIKLVTGMDFYVYKGLYLGAELGLGYYHEIALKGTATEQWKFIETNADGDVIGSFEDKLETKVNDTKGEGNLNFYCNPMIRIGWKF